MLKKFLKKICGKVVNWAACHHEGGGGVPRPF